MPPIHIACYRHAAYYNSVVQTIHERYLQGHQAVLNALELFSIDKAQIELGLTWAIAHASTLEVDTLLIRYARFTEHVGGLHYRPQERISLLTAALTAAQRCRWHADEGKILGELGHLHRLLGDVQYALTLYQQRLQLAYLHRDARERSHAYGNLGIGYLHAGKVQRAVHFFSLRLKTARQVGDRRGEGIALSHLAIADHRLTEEQRIANFQHHLAIANEIGDYVGASNALGNLGQTYLRLRDLPHAIASLQQQHMLARDLGDQRNQAHAQTFLGICHLLQGDVQSAVSCLQIGLELADRIGDPSIQSIAAWNLGLAFEQLNELELAVAHLRITIDIEQASNHPDTSVHVAYLTQLQGRRERA